MNRIGFIKRAKALMDRPDLDAAPPAPTIKADLAAARAEVERLRDSIRRAEHCLSIATAGDWRGAIDTAQAILSVAALDAAKEGE